MNINEEYQSNMGMIFRHAHLYSYLFDMDFEETVAELNLQFCHAFKTYKKGKGKFKTWLWRCLTNYCLEEARNKEIRKINYSYQDRFDIICYDRFDERILLNESIKSISKDAQMIIRMVFDRKEKKILNPYGHLTKASIKNYLLKNKWALRRINKSFMEIEKILYENSN